MIIDAHGHVTAPHELYSYRSNIQASRGGHEVVLKISDEAIETAVQPHIQRLKNFGIDLQLISPRPFTLMHSERPEKIVHWYIKAANDVIARQIKSHPTQFKGMAGLPQCAGVSPQNCLPELERCVHELGFVGCLLNPDPYEGRAEPPGLGDQYWYPLYEKLVELDVPALIHSASSVSERHTYSVNFILEETIAIAGLLNSKVFEDFPRLKIIVSHGGGAVPYQMGRFMAPRYRRGAERFEVAMKRLYFDTCLYTREALELLFKSVGPDRCLFGTEAPGTGSATNPDTKKEMDDVKPLIEGIDFLSDADRKMIFEGNAKKVFKLS